MSIWASFGFYCLIFLAGLQNIPKEYYEASEVEGASAVKQFFSITIPLLKPIIAVAFIINIILAFQVFGEIYIMTKGGPLQIHRKCCLLSIQHCFSQTKNGIFFRCCLLYFFYFGDFFCEIQLKLSKKNLKKTLE